MQGVSLCRKAQHSEGMKPHHFGSHQYSICLSLLVVLAAVVEELQQGDGGATVPGGVKKNVWTWH